MDDGTYEEIFEYTKTLLEFQERISIIRNSYIREAKILQAERDRFRILARGIVQKDLFSRKVEFNIPDGRLLSPSNTKGIEENLPGLLEQAKHIVEQNIIEFINDFPVSTENVEDKI
jgi:hypothetical protein